MYFPLVSIPDYYGVSRCYGFRGSIKGNNRGIPVQQMKQLRTL